MRLLLIFTSASALAACATYQPAPLAPRNIVQNLHNNVLDANEVAGEVRTIAPSANWDGAHWDRLALFAAALRLNPTLAEARAHVASLDAAARAAKAGQAMTLTLTAEYAGNAPESSPWLWGVGSDIPLDTGRRRSSRIDAAGLAALSARYDFADTAWATRMVIRRSLADLMASIQEADIATRLSEVRTRQLTALERRVAGGEAIRSDLERLRSDASADSRRLVDAEARKLAARATLAEAIGLTPTALDGIDIAWPEFAEAPPPAAVPLDARGDALVARPDVLKAAADYDQAEANLRGEIARQWPEVHIGPGYTWERGLVKLPFALGLVLPPADLNYSAIAAAEARRSEAGVHLEAVIARALAAIDAAVIEASASHAALTRIGTVDLPAARRIAVQAEDELARGAIDRVDWSAAQANALLAELAQVDALRRAHAADAALEDALRRPLEGPELMIAPRAMEIAK